MGRGKNRTKQNRRRGHYCWCCDRVLPNERFSGRGHRTHLCKDCRKLPRAERDVRQAVRDIDRLRTPDGRVARRHREWFAAFLRAEDERVRRYAEEVAERDARSHVSRAREGEGEDVPF